MFILILFEKGKEVVCVFYVYKDGRIVRVRLRRSDLIVVFVLDSRRKKSFIKVMFLKGD